MFNNAEVAVEIIRDIMTKHSITKVEIGPGDYSDSEVVSYTVVTDREDTFFSGNTNGEAWNHWRSPVAANENGDPV
jgi:hypothetical protein